MSKTSDLTKDVDELHARIDKEVGISEAKHARGNRRHAELAELVAEMTVALEVLEKKVEALDGLYTEAAGLVPDRVKPDYIDTVDWVRGPRGGTG